MRSQSDQEKLGAAIIELVLGRYLFRFKDLFPSMRVTVELSLQVLRAARTSQSLEMSFVDSWPEVFPLVIGSPLTSEVPSERNLRSEGTPHLFVLPET